MAESMELVSIEKANALTVFTEPSAIDPILAKIRSEIDGFTPDVSTATSRKAVASMAYKVAQSKTYLDGIGKELADAQKEIPKRIDASRKRIRDTLDAWRDEVRAPLTEWESKDAARIDGHKSALQCIDDAGAMTWADHTVDELRAALASVESVAMGDCWQEFASVAAVAKDEANKKLRASIAAREKHDAEQAELAKLRREQSEREAKEAAERAERERAERDSRIAQEAAERARKAAEAEAAEQQAKAERDRIAAEAAQKAAEQRAAAAEAKAKAEAELAARRAVEAQEQAKRDADIAVQRERERAASAKRQEEAESKAREKDREHKASINNQAVAALVAGGLSQDAAILAVNLIAGRKIPHATISY